MFFKILQQCRFPIQLQLLYSVFYDGLYKLYVYVDTDMDLED